MKISYLLSQLGQVLFIPFLTRSNPSLNTNVFSYLHRWFPLSLFVSKVWGPALVCVCVTHCFPLCCWCLDWLLSPILTQRPASGSSDLLVAEAGISFLFVLEINLSPGPDSAFSVLTRWSNCYYQCRLSSVLCWLIPPDVLASRGSGTHWTGKRIKIWPPLEENDSFDQLTSILEWT